MCSMNLQFWNLALSKIPVFGTKYQMIQGESNPTYIPSSQWAPKVCRFGSGTGTHTWQPKNRMNDMLGVLLDCSSMGVWVFNKVGLSLSKVVVWSTACPHMDAGRLACRSSGLVFNWIFFMKASADPFWECSYGIEYVSVIRDATQ